MDIVDNILDQGRLFMYVFFGLLALPLILTGGRFVLEIFSAMLLSNAMINTVAVVVVSIGGFWVVYKFYRGDGDDVRGYKKKYWE